MSLFPPLVRRYSWTKYEGQAFAMIFRRLARPATVLLALWCLWQIFKSDFKVLVPVVHEVPITPAIEAPVEPVAKPVPEIPVSRIAKVSLAANSLNVSIIHKALQSHKVQNDIHGYQHFIATNELVDDMSEKDYQHRPRGAWSKPAYLLSIIVAELAKPKSERLEWIL
jgi:hypothetical protein